MQRRIESYDQNATEERESVRTTAKDGRKDSSKKSGKGSNRKRRGSGRNGAKNQRDATRRQAYKVSEVISQGVTTKLDALKERLK